MQPSDDLSHLLHALAAFLQEHRYCGELDGGVEEDQVWMSCTCGAVISRVLEPLSNTLSDQGVVQ